MQSGKKENNFNFTWNYLFHFNKSSAVFFFVLFFFHFLKASGTIIENLNTLTLNFTKENRNNKQDSRIDV